MGHGSKWRHLWNFYGYWYWCKVLNFKNKRQYELCKEHQNKRVYYRPKILYRTYLKIEYAAYGLVIEYVIACDLKIKMQMCRRHQNRKITQHLFKIKIYLLIAF